MHKCMKKKVKTCMRKDIKDKLMEVLEIVRSRNHGKKLRAIVEPHPRIRPYRQAAGSADCNDERAGRPMSLCE